LPSIKLGQDELGKDVVDKEADEDFNPQALPAPFRRRWAEVSAREVAADADKYFNPQALPAPAGPPSYEQVTVPNVSAQVLRSRFRYKIPDRLAAGGAPWTGPVPGGIYEVRDVLAKAIAAAQSYIYIEDQFLEDNDFLTVEDVPDGFSLYPKIAAAIIANPALKVIFVGSGLADPDDLYLPGSGSGEGLLNLELTDDLRRMVASIPVELQTNVAVWRVEGLTVHSKLVLVDDEFAAIGSANFQERSMYGVDLELHAAFVDTDTKVRDLRAKLWTEHLRQVVPVPSGTDEAMKDLPRALGIWRAGWYPADPSLWRAPNRPSGFDPGRSALGFVGPGEH
jgi:phosphatidylserine/phosphatidylglycerophosphate/cardiolipin synthase-like enzyme